jgi:sulfhydrogenase subunit beta (sulfur reductase)
MNKRVLDKTALTDFLEDLLKAQRVYAPVERDGLIAFEPLSRAEDATLDYTNSKQSPKGVFLPCSETLFAFEGGEVTAVPLPDQQVVALGIRPCDAGSLGLLDKVFDASDDQDPYYVARRQNTVIVGLGCNQPLSTCFCTALGGGPFAVDGVDLLFSDLGDRYLVEAITERGEALVADSPHFGDADEADLDLKADIAARAEHMVKGPDMQGVKEKLDGMYDDPFWDTVHQKCLGCGVCTYLCPTCHCFDIVDEVVNDSGRRVRNWDTCQFSLFTLHASGHNPRPSGRERMRQRVMHKFRYFVENYGEVACVGCGRCVRECPVNLDIRAVVEAVRES